MVAIFPLALTWALTAGALSQPVDTIPAAEARRYVGQVKTVCGRVASARFLASSRSQPTFLNFDRPYPRHVFSVVIFGDHREKFGEPEVRYLDKEVCVTGQIKEYRGEPEIIAEEPSQIVERQKPR